MKVYKKMFFYIPSKTCYITKGMKQLSMEGKIVALTKL
jgi:hypothetical protein